MEASPLDEEGLRRINRKLDGYTTFKFTKRKAYKSSLPEVINVAPGGSYAY